MDVDQKSLRVMRSVGAPCWRKRVHAVTSDAPNFLPIDFFSSHWVVDLNLIDCSDFFFLNPTRHFWRRLWTHPSLDEVVHLPLVHHHLRHWPLGQSFYHHVFILEQRQLVRPPQLSEPRLARTNLCRCLDSGREEAWRKPLNCLCGVRGLLGVLTQHAWKCLEGSEDPLETWHNEGKFQFSRKGHFENKFALLLHSWGWHFAGE